MRWLISIAALLPFLFVILVAGGTWRLSFGPGHILPERMLEIPMTIWLSIGAMVFTVILSVLAAKFLDFDEDQTS